MKSSDELARDFSSIKERRIPRAQKRPLVEEVRRGIERIEQAAIKDFGFPFREVTGARRLLVEIDEWLRSKDAKVSPKGGREDH